MTTTDDPSPGAQSSVVDYAGPRLGRRHRFKHVAAIVFAVFAILLAALFTFNAVHFYGRSVVEPTTRDKQLFLQDAARFLACGLVLIGPAVWYARVGIRGEPSGGDPPGRCHTAARVVDPL
jgi:hypothetical protein